MENEKYKKTEQRSNHNKIIYLIFCIWKRTYFCRKHSLEKCSLHYYISSKFFSFALYSKRSNETATSMRIYNGHVDHVL